MTAAATAQTTPPPTSATGGSATAPAEARSTPRPPTGAAAAAPVATGSAAFVGTGPGDPGLLTLRAAELLAAADVVVLDAAGDGPASPLASSVAARHAPAGDVVTTAAGTAAVDLVSREAAAGRRVVRLLDGDVAGAAGFARELAALRSAGVACEVVPGVSPATAVPLYAGVATTGDDVAEVHVVDAALGAGGLDALGAAPGTVVLTGAAGDVVTATKALVAAGRAAGEEVVVTGGGTTTAQRTVSATLASLPEVLAADGEGLVEPLVAVVGPGTAHRAELAWFEDRPLFGWRVLVPRTQAQSSATVARLAAVGAVSEVVPTIAVEPPRTPHQMEKAVRGLVTGRYEWVAFTSVNAVRAVKDKFAEYGLDARAFSGLKVAAVGGVTAQALRDWGIEPDLVPRGESSASGLLEDWPPYDEVLDPIDRVFLPRADIATETLVEGLTALGWQVDDVTAYRTVRAAPPPAPIRDAIKSGAFDAVVFTSSSTVRNLVGIAGKPHPATVVACIGPATCATATELGLRVDVQAAAASAEALVDALAAHGAALREAAVAAGEPVRRPSERRTGVRRRR